MDDRKGWNFPQYRKYKGLNTWYKISGVNEFAEIKQVGESYLLSHISADQYPEKLRIQDMLNCHEERWEVTEEKKWSEIAELLES